MFKDLCRINFIFVKYDTTMAYMVKSAQLINLKFTPFEVENIAIFAIRPAVLEINSILTLNDKLANY